MGQGSRGYEMISPKIQKQECASEIMRRSWWIVGGDSAPYSFFIKVR